MGQKVSPIGLRIGINKTWESTWYADNKNFAKYIQNDAKIRKFLFNKLKDASVASILIERNAKKTDVIIHYGIFIPVFKGTENHHDFIPLFLDGILELLALQSVKFLVVVAEDLIFL